MKKSSQQHEGEPVLLTGKWGQYEGTYPLPVKYEGSAWDRWYGRVKNSGARGSSRIVLTPSKLVIARMFGHSKEIALKNILETHACTFAGGKFWGTDRTLKVILSRNGAVLFTVLITGPGKIKASDWKTKIDELVQSRNISTENDDMKENIEYIRNENNKLTALFLIGFSPFWPVSGWKVSINPGRGYRGNRKEWSPHPETSAFPSTRACWSSRPGSRPRFF